MRQRRSLLRGQVYDQGVPQAVLGGSEGAHESRRGEVRNNHDYDDDYDHDHDHDHNHDNCRAPSRLPHDGRVEDYHGKEQEQKDTPVRGS